MPLNYPLIQGHRVEFSSVLFSPFGSQRIVGVRSIGWNSEQRGAKVFGTSTQPIGRTRGQWNCDGAFSMYIEEWDAFIRSLVLLAGVTSVASSIASAIGVPNVAVAPAGFQEVPFNITIGFQEAPVTPMMHLGMFGCRIAKWGLSASQGADPLAIDAELDVMMIQWNRLSPINLLAA